MKKIVVALCFLLGLAILWMARYTLVPGTEHGSPAYKLDRFSGKVSMIFLNRETEVIGARGKRAVSGKSKPEKEGKPVSVIEEYRKKLQEITEGSP